MERSTKLFFFVKQSFYKGYGQLKQSASLRFLFLNIISILEKRFCLYQRKFGENHGKIQNPKNELCVQMFATHFADGQMT